MVGCLIVGAIPTALAGLVYNYPGLMAIRFFVGILGGTFVPCQVWTTVFYDDNVIGRVNAFAAGWGNAGGGVTFFVMPAVVAGLMQTGYTVHTSWRVAFAICPFVIIVFTAGLILVFGHDTPNGPWRKQNNMIQVSTQNSIAVQLSEIPPNVEMVLSKNDDGKLAETNISTNNSTDWKTALKVIFTFQTALVALPYLCSFGSELAVEGMISSFYVQQAKISEQLWSQQKAGNWAAMFGLLNIVTRPAGGYIADLLYRNENVQLKKYWMLFTGLVMSIFFLWIGLTQLHIAGLVGAMAVLAVFMDAANGAVFAVVPHIHVHYQGIVAGLTGACGSLGGILFNLAFRYNGTNYHKALWQIGIVCSTINILLVWIKIPSSKHK
ncbi:unnamed protein product [Didymodactylos carnosus]|uniref:Nitrate/nitrite transporter n=1 Tax=Didymodactylos carnosus TaxID=1234261 RepID=A0A814JQX0_9BILA|nr:unnamed protein product [Didymodactylos carnosus]CAF1348522.1 unnamed protein product [Didymodactylos carnosus]CAF3809344.1 unnamed protein product [Didymodactylos carnosus]CAF4159190.1 unnamed protein product [Didymodactylos carnosus]